ncbi:MAG: endo-1,4-beta-xylanase [Luteolibacter sp.]
MQPETRSRFQSPALIAVLFSSAAAFVIFVSHGVFGAETGEKPTLAKSYQDHFRVGVAINRTIAIGAAVQANNVNRTLEQVKSDIAVAKEQFNQISPENDLKWALIHPNEGKDGYDFGPADAFVQFGIDNHQEIVGHTLVWHGQTPPWVFAGTHVSEAAKETPAPENASRPAPAPGRQRGFDPTQPHASREELLERMREHIHTVVGRYKGKIKVWDVVNEALADGGPDVLRRSAWSEIIGPDFIAKAFEYAHEADPDAILRYNDYSLENPEKRKKLISLIKSLQEAKAPVMAIGTQTHISATSPSYEELDRTITELASLGLPVHITELDINTAERGQRNTGADVANNAETTGGGQVEKALERQAEQYVNLFKVCLKHKDSVKMITLWGVNDGVSWRAAGKPLLFDASNQPKPAYDALIRLTAKPGN